MAGNSSVFQVDASKESFEKGFEYEDSINSVDSFMSSVNEKYADFKKLIAEMMKEYLLSEQKTYVEKNGYYVKMAKVLHEKFIYFLHNVIAKDTEFQNEIDQSIKKIVESESSRLSIKDKTAIENIAKTISSTLKTEIKKNKSNDDLDKENEVLLEEIKSSIDALKNPYANSKNKKQYMNKKLQYAKYMAVNAANVLIEKNYFIQSQKKNQEIISYYVQTIGKVFNAVGSVVAKTMDSTKSNAVEKIKALVQSTDLLVGAIHDDNDSTLKKTNSSIKNGVFGFEKKFDNYVKKNVKSFILDFAEIMFPITSSFMRGVVALSKKVNSIAKSLKNFFRKTFATIMFIPNKLIDAGKKMISQSYIGKALKKFFSELLKSRFFMFALGYIVGKAFSFIKKMMNIEEFSEEFKNELFENSAFGVVIDIIGGFGDALKKETEGIDDEELEALDPERSDRRISSTRFFSHLFDVGHIIENGIGAFAKYLCTKFKWFNRLYHTKNDAMKELFGENYSEKLLSTKFESIAYDLKNLVDFIKDPNDGLLHGLKIEGASALAALGGSILYGPIGAIIGGFLPSIVDELTRNSDINKDEKDTKAVTHTMTMFQKKYSGSIERASNIVRKAGEAAKKSQDKEVQKIAVAFDNMQDHSTFIKNLAYWADTEYNHLKNDGIKYQITGSNLPETITGNESNTTAWLSKDIEEKFKNTYDISNDEWNELTNAQQIVRINWYKAQRVSYVKRLLEAYDANLISFDALIDKYNKSADFKQFDELPESSWKDSLDSNLDPVLSYKSFETKAGQAFTEEIRQYSDKINASANEFADRILAKPEYSNLDNQTKTEIHSELTDLYKAANINGINDDDSLEKLFNAYAIQSNLIRAAMPTTREADEKMGEGTEEIKSSTANWMEMFHESEEERQKNDENNISDLETCNSRAKNLVERIKALNLFADNNTELKEKTNHFLHLIGVETDDNTPAMNATSPVPEAE